MRPARDTGSERNREGTGEVLRAGPGALESPFPNVIWWLTVSHVRMQVREGEGVLSLHRQQAHRLLLPFHHPHVQGQN